MIYHPSKEPKKAFVTITIVAFGGILGGYLLSKWIMAASLLFWLQYTAVLSYIQFSKKKRYPWLSFTETLLHPQVRFFIFEFLAVVGLFSVVFRNWLDVGAAVLIAWWLFSLNFYRHYKEFKKYS